MKQKMTLLAAFFVILCGFAVAQEFKIENGKFLLDGKPQQFICGEMHYPRIPQEYTVGPASWAGFVCKSFGSASPGFQFP